MTCFSKIKYNNITVYTKVYTYTAVYSLIAHQSVLALIVHEVTGHCITRHNNSA